MLKSEKIISEYFKEYFLKYKELESFSFYITYSNDIIEIIETDYDKINEIDYFELSNKLDFNEYSENLESIIKSVKKIKHTDNDFNEVLNILLKIKSKFKNKIKEENPLLKILEDVLNDKNIKEVNSKILKSIKKEIPWKYVDYCVCYVYKDGRTLIEEVSG